MIKKLTSLDSALGFIDDLNSDPEFSDPMLSTPEQIEKNLMNAVNRIDEQVLGVYEDDVLTGLFVFLILDEDKYIEMIVGLSRSAAAYEEIADWLQAQYPGYQADFVFNPANKLLKNLLVHKQAEFDEEMQKMVLVDQNLDVDTMGVEVLSEPYWEQYKAIHGKDVYWTAERVIEAPYKFRTLIAIDGQKVVGYMDVTHCFDENEPFDVWVEPPYRRRGWGRKMVAKAIELNRPKDMMLLVDVSNEPAINLYESMGFVKVKGQNNLTVTLKL